VVSDSAGGRKWMPFLRHGTTDFFFVRAKGSLNVIWGRDGNSFLWRTLLDLGIEKCFVEYGIVKDDDISGHLAEPAQ
jgi:hypothetical protein